METTATPFTQTEIEIHGRRYGITRVEDKTELCGPCRYILTGVRGASYSTMRNAHHKDRMFLIDNRRFGPASVLKDVWLTDKDGTLKVLR